MTCLRFPHSCRILSRPPGPSAPINTRFRPVARERLFPLSLHRTRGEGRGEGFRASELMTAPLIRPAATFSPRSAKGEGSQRARAENRAGDLQSPSVGYSKSRRLRAGHPQRGGCKPPARACRALTPHSPFPFSYSLHLAASSRRTICVSVCCSTSDSSSWLLTSFMLHWSSRSIARISSAEEYRFACGSARKST